MSREYGGNVDRSDDPTLLVVNTDLELRYRVAAEHLELDIPSSSFDLQTEKQADLLGMLRSGYDGRVQEIQATRVRHTLNDAIRLFKEESVESGRIPVVISLDPIFLDSKLADYTFQESRASLVDPNSLFIDLENNPRGYTNRFVDPATLKANGAGKGANAQLEEILSIVDSHEDPVSLAIVEDYVNTGKSIFSRFGALMERPDVDTTVFSGLVNTMTKDHFGDLAKVVSMTEIPHDVQMRHMDMSDLLPTLGGRALALPNPQISASNYHSLYTIEASHDTRTPVAVDAICGDYPWQVDLYKNDIPPALLHTLGKFSIQASHNFWKSFEEMANAELEWKDLTALNGIVKTYYPVRNLTQIQASHVRAQKGPRAAIESLNEEYYA